MLLFFKHFSFYILASTHRKCVLKMFLFDTGFSKKIYMGLLEIHASLEPTATGQVLPVI